MDKILVEANSYYIDKEYVKFDSLHQHFHLNNAFFVTRVKENMLYEVIDSREVGVFSEETIKLTGALTSQKYPYSLILVVYEDFSTNKAYRFISNDFKLEALTIAKLYREKWQIELFFKWIKQYLHIKTFYGSTKNTMHTQIQIAIFDYLLLIIAKKHYILNPSPHSISNYISQILFKRSDIRDVFNQTDLKYNASGGNGHR